MRSIRTALLCALLATWICAGCGDKPDSSSMKPPDSPALDQMKNDMTNRLKSKNYVNKAGH